MTDEQNQSTLARLLKAYTKMRERRSELKRGYDEQDSLIKQKMSLVETQLLKMLNDSGSDSLKVDGIGQAYLSKQTFVKVQDWPAFWDHVLNTKQIDLLQKRVASRAVQEYQEDQGKLPPGVDVSVERVVNVRRA